MDELEILKRLGTALAIGLMVGIERGWSLREANEGWRIAGIRTFALIAMLGALWVLAGRELGSTLVAVGFAGFAALLVTTHWLMVRATGDYGITTEVAAFITFALGALAMNGQLAVAAVAAVVTATLLSLKPTLHRWVRNLVREEVHAGMQLLLISVVLLPVLPDRGYGPDGILNPRELWWFVVLIATLSFAGHFAIKLAGPRRGVMLTALIGGAASSTAVTLSLSQLARTRPDLHPVLAAGVVLACTTMFPRVLLIVLIIDPALCRAVLLPLATMALVGYLVAGWLWRHRVPDGELEPLSAQPPPSLRSAIQFGAVLALVMILVTFARRSFGDAGIYALTAIAALTDVDPINIALARLMPQEIALSTAAGAVVLGAAVNTLVKAAIAAFVSRGRLAATATGALALVVLAGGVAAWFGMRTGSV